jgi:hypothetical protein
MRSIILDRREAGFRSECRNGTLMEADRSVVRSKSAFIYMPKAIEPGIGRISRRLQQMGPIRMIAVAYFVRALAAQQRLIT